MRDVWSGQGPAPSERYQAMHAGFSWQIPETFNFATDVVDRWAAGTDRPALLWENAAGDERAFNYSDLARLSCQLANVLRARGVEKGDRVIIMLPRVPNGSSPSSQRCGLAQCLFPVSRCSPRAISNTASAMPR